MLVASIVVVVAFLLLASRLVYLQVVRHDDLSEQAENNRTAIVPVVPNRGLILDRNGIVLATNFSAYTLEITPARLTAQPGQDHRRAVAGDRDPAARQAALQASCWRNRKSFDSLPIRTKPDRRGGGPLRRAALPLPGRGHQGPPVPQLSLGRAGQPRDRLHRPHQPGREEGRWRTGPRSEQANYRGTEYIGKLGVEQSYEKQLHGITGVEQVETSAGGRAVRKLASSPATPGNTVMLSIDIKLQKLIEDMYGERRGALVALDPKTGEVLAFVSKPTFDPNLFVDGIDSENWQMLNESIDKPLLNRALRGTYPPGSTYKPFMAMAALETGKRSPHQVIHDGGSWSFGGHVFRSHGDHGLGAVDMHTSIVQVEQRVLLLAGQRAWAWTRCTTS